MRKLTTDKEAIICNMIIMVLVIYCQHIQLMYSTSVSIKRCLTMDFRLQMLNFIIVVIPFLIGLMITNSILISLGVSSVLISVLSLINYHVYLYHGTPFMASDIYNISTAMNVLSSYHVVFDSMVKRLILISFAEIIMIAFAWVATLRKAVKTERKMAAMTLVADLVFLWFMFFSHWTLFPNNLVSWSWEKPIGKYGYETCLLNNVHTILNKYTVMEGYDVRVIQSYLLNKEEILLSDQQLQYPDIMVILNESLCDLNYCAGISEGAKVLEGIYNIPGIFSGYTTVPLIGGGTNCSEYELLTSNSFYQISVASPFTALDMSQTDNIVQYLKHLGYTSTGMHCYSEENYSRNEAYPALGFDEVYLGEEYYTYNCYGNREWLDKDNYQDMIDLYKNAEDSDSPQFMYMLTFQNHGGYEQNSPQFDKVNISSDFGQYNDDINEYLSSIQLSSKAFAHLISELSESKRPIIVLMVGDHAPSFITDIPIDVSADKTEKSVTQRTVPYYVWANIELHSEVFTQTSTLTDLMPMVLKAADLPMSQYYNLINDIHHIIPVRTSDGIYIDRNNNIVEYSKNQPGDTLLRDYYYMEYNRLKHDEDYLEELYIPNTIYVCDKK